MVEAVERAERLRQISVHQAQAVALEREAAEEPSLQRAEVLRRRAEVRRAWVERLRSSVRGTGNLFPKP